MHWPHLYPLCWLGKILTQIHHHDQGWKKGKKTFQSLKVWPKTIYNSQIYSTLFESMTFSINISSVVEFQRWWVLKSKSFTQESTCSKEIVLKQSCDELWFVKKCRNCTFKVNFLCQKSTDVVQKKSFKNIILGYHFWRKHFF